VLVAPHACTHAPHHAVGCCMTRGRPAVCAEGFMHAPAGVKHRHWRELGGSSSSGCRVEVSVWRGQRGRACSSRTGAVDEAAPLDAAAGALSVANACSLDKCAASFGRSASRTLGRWQCTIAVKGAVSRKPAWLARRGAAIWMKGVQRHGDGGGLLAGCWLRMHLVEVCCPTFKGHDLACSCSCSPGTLLRPCCRLLYAQESLPRAGACRLPSPHPLC
jgi:hypothetical protein